MQFWKIHLLTTDFTTWYNPSRSPFFTKYPLGFIIAVAIDTIFAAIFIVAFKAFTTIYVVISTNIEAIANDISTSVARLNANIAHANICHELKEIVKLHLHTYRWDKPILLELLLIWRAFLKKKLHLKYIRLIEMLEYIIRAPIFYQIAVFAMQLAIFLCLIEAVSNFKQVINTISQQLSISPIEYRWPFIQSA